MPTETSRGAAWELVCEWTQPTRCAATCSPWRPPCGPTPRAVDYDEHVETVIAALSASAGDLFPPAELPPRWPA